MGVEPVGGALRQTAMNPTRTLVAALASLVLLAGCGSQGQAEPNAEDPNTTSSAPSSSPASPSVEPTVGTYPAYAPQDYDFTVRVSCFCMDAGTPIRIEVRGGEVVKATYAEKGDGHRKGQKAPKFRWVTMADIIKAANDTGAAQVDVTWPAGQDYPSTVYVDQDQNMADEEIGYDVSDVAVVP